MHQILLQTKSIDQVKAIELISIDCFKNKTYHIIERIDTQILDLLQTMYAKKIKFENTLILPFFMFKHNLPLLLTSMSYTTLGVRIEFETSVPTDITLLGQVSCLSSAGLYKLTRSTIVELIDSFIPFPCLITNEENISIDVLEKHSYKSLFISVFDIEKKCYVHDVVDDLILLLEQKTKTNELSCSLLQDNKNEKARVIDPLLHGLTPSNHFMISFHVDNALFANGQHYVSHGHININSDNWFKIKLKLHNPEHKQYRIDVCGLVIREISYNGTFKIN